MERGERTVYRQHRDMRRCLGYRRSHVHLGTVPGEVGLRKSSFCMDLVEGQASEASSKLAGKPPSATTGSSTTAASVSAASFLHPDRCSATSSSTPSCTYRSVDAPSLPPSVRNHKPPLHDVNHGRSQHVKGASCHQRRCSVASSRRQEERSRAKSDPRQQDRYVIPRLCRRGARWGERGDDNADQLMHLHDVHHWKLAHRSFR